MEIIQNKVEIYYKKYTKNSSNTRFYSINDFVHYLVGIA